MFATSAVAEQQLGGRKSPPAIPRVYRRPPAVSVSPFSLLQRKANCACGGGCPRCKAESENLKVQTKLAVSSPGDMFEREADAVADQVMRMPDPGLQRQCKSGADASAPSLNYEETPQIKRRSNSNGGSGEVSADFTSRLGAGVSLDTDSRRYFEPRFGRDFSSVRVHADDDAARSAAAVDARAYTIGNDVVFGAGEWSPGTMAGQRLLAHELTHVAQQAEGAPPMVRRALVLEDEPPPPGDFWKNEVASPSDTFWKNDMGPTGEALPLEAPNKAPSCDEVCGNSEDKCVREPSEQCSDDMSKKVMAAWTTAASQIATAIDAMNESPLSATTLASLKANFNWSPGTSPKDLATTVSTNLSTASTKMSDNLCIKCLGECPTGAKAQIARARGQNCLGSNCFSICPDFAATDTHVLVHELFHRVVSSVQDLYRGQSGYPPPPSMALKMPDCYASLIDDTAAAAAAAAKAKAGGQSP